ncbi:MAG: phosphoglycerate kinase [Actinomycetota bacterium]|nr:phosphoglycerate kinase [Actinomycetota bacterium]
MSHAWKSVRDAPVEGRRVLVRSDLNVPLSDGGIADDTRIRAAVPTIETLLKRDAAVVLVSHLGRPESRDELSMRPVRDRLARLLSAPVTLASGVVGDDVTAEAEALAPGQVLLLENSRWEAGETENDRELAGALAGLADLYVNDAFGAAHRAHATTEGVAHLLPSYAGLLLERELSELTALRDDPEPPVVVVLGGAKVTDKVGVLKRFLEIADTVLIGGAMCFVFFRARGVGTGDSLVEEEGVALAEDVLEAAERSDCELVLPTDLVIGDSFTANAERKELDGIEVPDGWMGLDIGPETTQRYAEAIAEAGSVLWNGPMGAFELEPFAAGTRGVAKAVASTAGRTVVGGGDSAAALVAFGLDQEVDWLSTGGGASLELLEGKELPGVVALEQSNEEGDE